MICSQTDKARHYVHWAGNGAEFNLRWHAMRGFIWNFFEFSCCFWGYGLYFVSALTVNIKLLLFGKYFISLIFDFLKYIGN